MKKRIISGVIAGIFFIAIILSNRLSLRILSAAVSFIALREMYGAVGITKNWYLTMLGLFTSVIFSFEYIFKLQYLPQVGFGYIVLLFLCLMIFRKTLSLSDIAKSFFLTIFICYFYSSVVRVSDMENGDILIWFIFIGAWMTDTFAYFVGTLFGKHKLCPEISPKKTIEGAIGGLVGTMLFMCAFSYILAHFFGYNVNYLLVALLGLICGIAAQFGDLSASVIKREFNIKDFGTFLPGHGGILDRSDSLLFVGPAAYIFFMYLGQFMLWK